MDFSIHSGAFGWGCSPREKLIVVWIEASITMIDFYKETRIHRCHFLFHQILYIFFLMTNGK